MKYDDDDGDDDDDDGDDGLLGSWAEDYHYHYLDSYS